MANPEEQGNQYQAWWAADCKAARHERVFEAVRAIQRDCRDYYEEVRLYESLHGVRDESRSPLWFLRGGRLRCNLAKSVVETAVSKIGSKTPKAMFLTKKGSYKARKNGARMTDAVEAVKMAAGYPQLSRRAFQNACVSGDGWVKWVPVKDHKGARVEAMRVFPEEIVVDKAEGKHGGTPPNMYHVTSMSRAALKRQFPDKAKLIDDAPDRGHDEWNDLSSERFIKTVRVVHAMHLPVGGKGGLHVVALENGVLAEAEWIHDLHPVVRHTWAMPLRGYYGHGVVEEVAPYQYEINRLLWLITHSIELVSVPRVYVHAGTKLTLQHLNNEIGNIISYDGVEPPDFYSGRALDPEVYDHLKWLIMSVYEITGVSQMQATGRKPAGLDSGVALREFHDRETERFAAVAQAWEESHLQSARVIVALLDDLAGDGAVKINMRGDNAIEQVDWGEVRGEVDEYELRLYPTNLLPSTPAGQIQTAQELVGGGLLTPDTMRRVLSFPDLDAVLEDNDAPGDLLDAYIEAVFEGEEAEEPLAELIPPDLAASRARNAMARALSEGVPLDRVQIVNEWLINHIGSREAGPQQPQQPQQPTPGAQPPQPQAALMAG